MLPAFLDRLCPSMDARVMCVCALKERINPNTRILRAPAHGGDTIDRGQ
jgi:hypothetical protein